MYEIALSRISNLIKVEEDLSKLGQIKQQFHKEKSSIDVKLNSTTQQQIETIINNLTQLNNTSAKLSNIKFNINKMNQIHEESVVNIKNYETILKMISTNQFMTQVTNLYRDLPLFKTFVNELKDSIARELEEIKSSLDYPLTNIFIIHYNLNQVRNFQDYLECNYKYLSDDLKSIINKIITPIKACIKAFDDLLYEIISSVTEGVKDQNHEMVFKLIKVLEFESNEDLKLDLYKNLNLDHMKDLKVLNYYNFRGNKRNYLNFFYTKLEASLNDTFNECLNHFLNDKVMVYENLDWLEDELVFVVKYLHPLFPTQWEISNFIQNVYFNNLHKFTMNFIKDDPSTEDLMKVLNYDNHFNKFMTELEEMDPNTSKTKSNGKSSKDKESANDSDSKDSDSKDSSSASKFAVSKLSKPPKSIMGEELKEMVLDDYLRVIKLKMEEWNNNLMKQETLAIKDRSSSPHIYSYHQVIEDYTAQDQIINIDINTDVFVLPDFKTSLSMLKEQADVAANSGYSKILVGVIENWSALFIQRIFNYKLLIEQEFDDYMFAYNNERFLVQHSKRRLFKKKVEAGNEDLSPEELAKISKPGLVEYLVAIGNTYEINSDRLNDKFLPNYKEKVHLNYQQRIVDAFEETINPTTDLISMVIRFIVDIIINDLYPSLSTVFTKLWYENKEEDVNMAQRIVETIVEYMEELRSYTSYELYLVTFTVLLDSFISEYIKIGYGNILHGGGKKIDPTAVKKYKSFSEAVTRDATIFYGAFEALMTRKDSEYLFNSLRALEFLGDLGTCENPMQTIPQLWENEILPAFYYCSVEYVRGVCLCRKDMDKGKVEELMDVLVDIQRGFQANVEPPEIVIGTLNDNLFN